MRYDNIIPQATRQDLAESLGSPDPDRFAADRLLELAELDRLLDIERRKWQGVRETASLFPDTQPDATSLEAPITSPNGSGEPSGGDLEARPRRTRKSLQEYPALLRRLFDEQPNTVWRTQELTRGLIEREFVDGTEREEANRVTRALKLLLEQGVIVSLKKGQYKRVTAQPQSPRFYGGPAESLSPLQVAVDHVTTR